jgi:hypothetical protein
MNSWGTDWANSFVAEVGASAALTGLLVVAISINLTRILSFEQLPGRVAEGIITLIGSLVLSSPGLVPNQPPALFGVEALAIGIVIFLIQLIIQLGSWDAIAAVSPTKQYSRAIVGAAPSSLVQPARRSSVRRRQTAIRLLAPGS